MAYGKRLPIPQPDPLPRLKRARNPFGHPPWRDHRTFAAMFDILEADIVVFQETKIQRKDLKDDMVLIPGWDCYWSLPRHKKGSVFVLQHGQ